MKKVKLPESGIKVKSTYTSTKEQRRMKLQKNEGGYTWVG